LTLTKIESLEEKLGSNNWLAKHPEQMDDLERQLEALQKRLVVNPTSNKFVNVQSPAVEQTNARASEALSARETQVLTETKDDDASNIVNHLHVLIFNPLAFHGYSK